MRRKKKSKFPAKYVLLIMTFLCAVIIGCSLKASETGPVSTAAGSVIAPMQKGVNKLGSALTNVRNHLQSKKSLETENEQLREQLADAQASLNQVQLNQEELDNLKKLYQMDQTYADYEKVAANVIGRCRKLVFCISDRPWKQRRYFRWNECTGRRRTCRYCHTGGTKLCKSPFHH